MGKLIVFIVVLFLGGCKRVDRAKVEGPIWAAAERRQLDVGSVDCYLCDSIECLCQVTIDGQPYIVRASEDYCGAFRLAVSN